MDLEDQKFWKSRHPQKIYIFKLPCSFLISPPQSKIDLIDSFILTRTWTRWQMTHNELQRSEQCSTFKALLRLEVHSSQCQRNRKNENILENLPETKKLVFNIGYNEQPRMWCIIFFNIVITSAQYYVSIIFFPICQKQYVVIPFWFDNSAKNTNRKCAIELRRHVCTISWMYCAPLGISLADEIQNWDWAYLFKISLAKTKYWLWMFRHLSNLIVICGSAKIEAVIA